ncbi:MAG: hypothetical protein IKM80_04310 [Bacilli bacterium]|nr:hypothetical protein [Bacilli bacterium]
MEKKRRTLRTALIISFASLVALTAAGGGVFAWFAMRSTASVNLANIGVAGESTTAALKYCTLNYQVAGTYDGYKSNDSRIDENATYDYDSFFLVADDNARQALEFSPGYSFTFAIEIQGSANSQVTISKYISEASSTYFYKENETKKGFALARALDVYSQVYSSKPTSSELYTYFSHQGVVGNDYFTAVEATTNAGTAINQPCSAPFNASSTAYFLMTMYFSDDPSTWYSVAKDNVDKDLEGVGNGSNKTFALPSGTDFVNSVTLTDHITATGDSLNVTLSANPYEINSVKVNGSSKTEGTDYHVNDNVIAFTLNPGANAQIEVDYVAAPSSFSFTSDAVTFKNPLLNGTTISVNCTTELDYYVQDSINGNSNVYEGLTIALTDLLIS